MLWHLIHQIIIQVSIIIVAEWVKKLRLRYSIKLYPTYVILWVASNISISYQYQIFNPENLHASNIIQFKQVIFRNTYVEP